MPDSRDSAISPILRFHARTDRVHRLTTAVTAARPEITVVVACNLANPIPFIEKLPEAHEAQRYLIGASDAVNDRTFLSARNSGWSFSAPVVAHHVTREEHSRTVAMRVGDATAATYYEPRNGLTQLASLRRRCAAQGCKRACDSKAKTLVFFVSRSP